MQVILDSSFTRPRSAPIWGGKKGESRDWTKASSAKDNSACSCKGWFTATELEAESESERQGALRSSVN